MSTPYWPPPPIDVLDRTDSTPARTQHPKDHDDLQVAVNALLLVLGATPFGQSDTLTAELTRLQLAITNAQPMHHVFYQRSTARTWVIVHNLGYDPVVAVVTDDGLQVLGFDLAYADDHNTVTLGFSQAITGRALLSN